MRFIPSRRESRRTPILAAIAGLAVGSAVAYWLRPGRKDALEKRIRRERLGATIPRSALIDDLSPAPEDIDDDLTQELIRSELRRCCSYPRAIIVTCEAGVVRLEGPILKAELNRVLRSVARVPGVEEIHDHLTAHRMPWQIDSTDVQTVSGLAGPA